MRLQRKILIKVNYEPSLKASRRRAYVDPILKLLIEFITIDNFEKLEKIFSTISKCEKGAERISDLLEVPVCSSGFKRLN